MFAFPSVDVFFGSSLACQRKHPNEARRHILAIPLSPQTPPVSREGKPKLRKKQTCLERAGFQREGGKDTDFGTHPPTSPYPRARVRVDSLVRTPLVVSGTWHWRWGICEARHSRACKVSGLVDSRSRVPAAGALRSQRAADRRGQRAARPGRGRGWKRGAGAGVRASAGDLTPLAEPWRTPATRKRASKNAGAPLSASMATASPSVRTSSAPAYFRLPGVASSSEPGRWVAGAGLGREALAKRETRGAATVPESRVCPGLSPRCSLPPL